MDTSCFGLGHVSNPLSPLWSLRNLVKAPKQVSLAFVFVFAFVYLAGNVQKAIKPNSSLYELRKAWR